MVKHTPGNFRRIIGDQHNIRNVTVLGHSQHGKSTVTDTLVAGAGVMSSDCIGSKRTDTRDDEIKRGMSIKATGISLLFERDGNEYAINLMNSPGHVDFSAEVSSALRVTDGALVVVDCIEGVCAQTKTVLRQACEERVRPVLIVNKMDRCFNMCLDGETAYQKIETAITNVTDIVDIYHDGDLRCWQFCPKKGSVAFSSGLHGWAFTLANFAKLYAPKFRVDESEMLERLWGDNFFDPKTKKWTHKNTGSGSCQRGFVTFCYEPIRFIMNTCLHNHGKKEKLLDMLRKLGLTLKNEDKELIGESLMKRVMQSWLPASTALLELIVFHLPSPVEAQKYRVDILYSGSPEDGYGNAIKNCDPHGPLIIYISKWVLLSDQHAFYAFGRVFSGSISTRSKVRIMGPKYVSGEQQNLFVECVQRIVVLMANKHIVMEDVPCGNLVALFALDQHSKKTALFKTATLTNEKEVQAYPIHSMKLHVFPTVRKVVNVEGKKSWSKFLKGLDHLWKTDSSFEYDWSEDQSMQIAGAGELHLDVCLEELKHFMGEDKVLETNPIVSFRETVSSSGFGIGQSKLNQIYVIARPLEDGLAMAIDEGRIGPNDDTEVRARILREEYGWDKDMVNKIWCFGPGPNMLVDTCKGVEYLNEVKDLVIAGFEYATKQGALAGEMMRGISFILCDAKLDEEKAKRILIPKIVADAINEAVLMAEPYLLEPILRVQIVVPTEIGGGIGDMFIANRGYMSKEKAINSTDLSMFEGYLPELNSSQFSSNVKTASSGQACVQFLSTSWSKVPPRMEAELVNDIRNRKAVKMPKVKTDHVKYPEGWELIEPTLRELQGKIREAENDHDGKRKCETLWHIFKIAYQKSRYVFDLYHCRKEISEELYEFCLDQGYADRNIIAKWKKPGYERLCCLQCIQVRQWDYNLQTTCVCRVPRKLREEKVVECVHCGCKGCRS